MISLSVTSRTFHFKQPAGTSRGVYTTRRSWFVTATSGDRTGMGECAPLPQLSCDDIADYDNVLSQMCSLMEHGMEPDDPRLLPYPSMRFGIETALRTMRRGCVFDTPFTLGEVGIPFNGLVWMGTFYEMTERVEEKLRQGFKCVKLKIGAIDFEQELALIRHIRSHHSAAEVELRVDANGGFTPQEAPERLSRLAEFDIHSIEQPVMARQWCEMARLCRTSPLPIALDEELIGVNTTDEKIELLNTLRPAFIVLKPSLHGGIGGTLEWIELAQSMGIDSWITSALESNVGLNAVAQLAAHAYGPHITMPQGLGTGQLYTDNIDPQLYIRDCQLWTTPNS